LLPDVSRSAGGIRVPAHPGVGRAFGVTRERIRQIETNTLKKLEHLPEAQALRDAVS
jgi:hypothetical protein